MYLTESKLKAIEMLAEYKFLTNRQLTKLGLRKNTRACADLTLSLTKDYYPLVDKKVFSINEGYGRKENIYFLTQRGKRFAENELFIEYVKAPSH